MNSATMYSDFGLFSQYLTYMYSRLSYKKPQAHLVTDAMLQMQYKVWQQRCSLWNISRSHFSVVVKYTLLYHGLHAGQLKHQRKHEWVISFFKQDTSAQNQLYSAIRIKSQREIQYTDQAITNNINGLQYTNKQWDCRKPISLTTNSSTW